MMSELTPGADSVRKQLDEIDSKVMGLLSERMEISAHMAEVKRGSGMPLFDPLREQAILEGIAGFCRREEDEELSCELEKAVEAVYLEILKQSRRIQSKALLPSAIYLIGYMGSGKTTVGEVLSEMTGFRLVDMDTEIQKAERASIRDIFNQKGEPYFRQKEEELLEKLSKEEELIVSCGGGVILSDKNRALLANTQAAVFLDGYPKAMFERIKEDPNRPNAYFENSNEEQRLAQFTKRYEKRKDRYTEAAKLTIFVDQETPEQLARSISYLLLEG